MKVKTSKTQQAERERTGLSAPHETGVAIGNETAGILEQYCSRRALAEWYCGRGNEVAGQG